MHASPLRAYKILRHACLIFRHAAVPATKANGCQPRADLPSTKKSTISSSRTKSPEVELMRLCNLKLAALRQRKQRLRTVGRLMNTEHDKKLITNAINAEIIRLVNGGILIRETMDALHKKICEAFPGHEPKRSKFGEYVRRVIWESPYGKEMDKALQGFVRVSMNPKEAFAPSSRTFPSRWLKNAPRGIVASHTKENKDRALPGIGRVRASKELGDLTKFRMPKTSFEKPYRVTFRW